MFYLIIYLYDFLTLDNFLKGELELRRTKAFIFKLGSKVNYIRSFMPMLSFLNGSVIFIASCILFVIGFLLTYLVTSLIIASVIMGLMASLVPYLILELIIQRGLQDISKEITKLISTMTRWSVIKDDLYFCIEKSLNFVEGPLHYYMAEFLITVRYTGHINNAFQELINKSNNESYLNFVMNIRQIEMSKGDLPYLLSRLEEEAFKIRGEQMRRDSYTALDRSLIYITGLAVLFLSILLVIKNEQFYTFYLESKVGNYLLVSYSILYILGFVYGKKINTFNY